MKKEPTLKVGIVGSGMIGRSWAIVFARAGHLTRIWDESSSALHDALQVIRVQLGELQQVGLIDDAEAAWQHVQAAGNLEETVGSADFVQENAPESIEIKRAIFSRLDRVTKENAILASSTSAIPASQFTEHLAGRRRCLVAHPANPPHLVPLVELCGAPWTTPEVMQEAVALFLRVGQQPIILRQEVPGFILNRLQGALLSEAFRLVESGCVSSAEVDIVMKHGLGLRWSFMGPFETIDLNAPGGLRDYCQRYGPFYSRLRADPPSPEPWNEELVTRLDEERRREIPLEQHAARQAWRDKRLMQLVAHERQMDQLPLD
jgi:L-gulonate 3-dehydrogenase